MKCFFVKLLVLTTFTFWATGFAKFVHEAIEHHGHDASLADDEDDDDSGSLMLPALQPAVDSQTPARPVPAKPAKPPCPICQMLAAMAVCHSTPSFMPAGVGPLMGTLILSDPIASPLQIGFAPSARGPPAIPFEI